MAGLSVFQLGEQDFIPSGGLIWDSDIKAAGLGEPSPFDGTNFGDDRTRSLGSIKWTHAFTLPALEHGDVIRSASLTIGVIDIDSPPGYPATVRLKLNGHRQPVDAFTGISMPGLPSSAQVVTVPVPVELLSEGELMVYLQAIRHAPGFPGNAIELDFSRLAIETSPGILPNPGGQDGSSHFPSGGEGGTGGTGGNSGGNGGPSNGPPTAIPLPRSDLGAAFLAGFIVLMRIVRRRRFF